jgi:hypothetical protein
LEALPEEKIRASDGIVRLRRDWEVIFYNFSYDFRVRYQQIRLAEGVCLE